MSEIIRPFDIGHPRVTPAELKRGTAYETPMGPLGPVLIISVGPRWITFRESKWHGWGPKRRLLRSGWEGPYFHEITDA